MKLMAIIFATIITVILSGCEAGRLNQQCHGDGTCDHGLDCDGSYCRLPAARQPAPPTKRRCFYESECYCVTCAEQCGMRGMKNCRFSDTTVWGNRTPATCECNTAEGEKP